MSRRGARGNHSPVLGTASTVHQLLRFYQREQEIVMALAELRIATELSYRIYLNSLINGFSLKKSIKLNEIYFLHNYSGKQIEQW